MESKILDELYQLVQERKVSAPPDSYTAYLYREGLDKILKKVGEEAAEVIIAAKNPEPQRLVEEIADLLYHLMVLLAEKNIAPLAVWQELNQRRK